MNDKDLNEIALFRFSLIAPVVNDSFCEHSKSEFFRNIASKPYILPDGSQVSFAAATIKHWFLDYRKYGFDALIPKTRKDLGKPRNIDNNAIRKIHEIKGEFPHITGKLVYQKLVEEGYIKVSATSLATVLRYIRDNNLKRSQLSPIDRRAFSMEFANDCWQSDTTHGPVITIDGKNRQTYLITFLDDASRLILHGEFFFNDNAVNMQKVFKKAISKYGVPKKLFVDNGASYKNDQLGFICASLGTVLIHSKPYSPESKGKIERSFRTIKDNWMNGINWNNYHNLDELNADFNIYLADGYTNTVHSALDMTPRNRFMQDYTKVKFIPQELLDSHFLHRFSRMVRTDATISIDNRFFEVPATFIGQRINIRFSPITPLVAFIFDNSGNCTDEIRVLNRVDNSKVKRSSIDYSKLSNPSQNISEGVGSNV
ncbi:MAG TPA: integrase [Clostridiales bacterium]|nr:integrase [Clostridiales bacterium]